MTPIWVPSDAVVAIQRARFQEHGGLIGPPRPDSLEAALARLAAVYGFALAKEHCFADDSNGAALAIIDLILQLNGSELGASEPDAVVTIKALAADDLSEDGLTEWIAAQSRPVGDNP